MRIAVKDWTFRPRLVPTLAAAITLALTLHLGAWQQGRASEKRALQVTLLQRTASPRVQLDDAARDADALRFRKVRAVGEWQTNGQVFIDNQVRDGRAGFFVLTPLRLVPGATMVLVNRGWIARDGRYPLPPLLPPLSGAATVEGMATLQNAKFLELSNAPTQGAVWQNLTIPRYRETTGQDVLPVVVLAEAGPATHGLVPVEEYPDARVGKHIEYMLTWYSLAATVLGLWLALNWQKNPQSPFQRPHDSP